MVFNHKTHASAFGTTYPVALNFLDGFRPVDGIQTFEQSIGISGNAQQPLFHFLTFHRMTTTYAVSFAYFVIGKHGSQRRAPVYSRFGQVGKAVIHQDFLLLLFAHLFPNGGGKSRSFVAGGIYTGIPTVCKLSC